jgi:ERCC4-type nuclease
MTTATIATTATSIVELILDCREHQLIDIFNTNNSQINATQTSYSYNTKQLLVGDIQISSGNYVLLIERKSVPDMIASINDGRYKEQKVRLLKHIEEQRMSGIIVRPFYIVEGVYNLSAPVFGRISKEQEHAGFTGSLISTQLRDNIPIFRTFNMDETVYLINRIICRMQNSKTYLELFNGHLNSNNSNGNGNQLDSVNSGANSGADGVVNSAEPSYLSNVKVKKSDNINPHSWNILALTSIPGVSNNIAECIINKYESIVNLLSVYKELITANNIIGAEKLLVDINIGSRKVGPVLSKRIYTYLNNISC